MGIPFEKLEICLDVYLDDEAGTIYNVEMQNTRDELPRRARYYQSGIDRHTLEKGDGYDSLRESYVIFVCNYDHFNRGLAVYEKVSTLRGCEDEIYDDGSHVYILNSRYKTKNAAEPIIQFLDCIRDGKFAENYADGSLMSVVVEAVNSVKTNSEKEGMYMTFAMKLADERRIGRAEGRTEERVESIMHLMEGLSLTREQAAKILKIPEDEWEKYFELIDN